MAAQDSSGNQWYAKRMASPEKENASILGLGRAASANPNAWRPSKARAKDSGLPLNPAGNQETSAQSSASGISEENRSSASSWRPSKANEERLSSLSPARRRRRLALPPRARLLLTFLFFACAGYFFLKLWLMPEAGELHPALTIAAAIIILLFASAIVSVAARRRRRKSADDKSTLRL